MYISGKSTCVTEDLIQMLIGMNKGNCQESKNRPVFFSFLKNTITLTGSNVLKFDEVTTNLGKNYNPSTGEFIAPRKGIYQFSCIIVAAGGNTVHYQLNRNNEVFTNGYTSKTSHANSSSHNWIIELHC